MRMERIGHTKAKPRVPRLAAVWLAMLLVFAACTSGEPSVSGNGAADAPATTRADATSDAEIPISDLMPPEERAAAMNALVGFINAEVVLESPGAEQQIVEYLLTQPAFVDAGLDESGSAWGLFSDGVLYSHMNRRPRTESDTPSALAPGGYDGVSTGAAPARGSAADGGLAVAYQTVSSGATLPDSTTAVLVKGLSDAYVDIPVDVRHGLTEAGYQVSLRGGSVEDLMLKDVSNIGVFYFNTHGGPAALWTSTPTSPAGDAEYAALIANEELGHGSAAVADNPDYDGDACLKDPENPKVCNREIEEDHYVIRPKFMRHFWAGRFASESFVVIDACNSSFLAPSVGVATGAGALAIWDGTVSQGTANRILTLYFDRLLGLNDAPPDETPDLRPFDAARVAGYLDATGTRTDGRTKLVITLAQASLVPSIKAITIDESKDEMVIEGMFGDQPGIVNFNEDFLEGVDWQRGVIRAPITDTMAGPVYVEQRGRRSNEVPVTEWRGQMSFFGDAGPLGKDLQIEADFDLHLRADIHMFRDLPQEDPVQREVEISAAGDSTSTWEAHGTSSQTGTKITASGSGDMKVEEEGMSHDDALFNVRALLQVSAWDLPPEISNATLHAHLSAEPNTEARLMFDIPGDSIDSGFPLPLTEALDPLPFEFDDRFDIEEGSTSGSAPGGFGAALSWTTLTANQAPNVNKPPPG